MNSYSLIVVDNDPARRDFLADNLAADGYTVVCVADEKGLGDAVRTARPALVILAAVNERGSRPQVIARLRAGETTGRPDPTAVLVLATDQDVPSRLACFDAGADDVVSAPISYAELRARIRAITARSAAMPLLQRLVLDRLTLVPETQTATWEGIDLGLTRTEFKLLACLASDPTRAWGRDELLTRVWGFETTPRSRTVDTHACRLRRKLADAGAQGWIVKRWATGYKLVDLDGLNPSTD